MIPWLAPAALLFALQGAAPRPVVSVEVHPATVTVGEPFTVRVRVRAEPGAAIRFPAVPDSADAIEAVDPRAIEDHSTSTAFDQVAIYRFVAWEPGRRAVPLGVVRQELARGVVTMPLDAKVEVTSMLPADTVEQEPRDARHPIEPPPAWWRWALGAVVALVIAWMSWRALRHRRLATRPGDAYVEAQAGFAAVDQLALDDAGEPGRALLAYAEVMREYLTRRFPPATVGLTTAEFVRALADNALPILPEEVQGVMERADAVKFAGAAVDAKGVAAVARAARGVVRDVQVAYEVRLAAAEKGPPRRARGRM